MDSISSVISIKADDLFKTPTVANDPIIDLEAPLIEAPIINDIDTLSMVKTDDDILFQEEVSINLPAPSIAEPVPSSPVTPSMKKLVPMIHAMRDQLDAMLRFINGDDTALANKEMPENTEIGEQIIEGLFNGEKMIDANGKEYAVAPNYASKTKLVEGDKMKLTITTNGRFIYKQISQIERKRLVGELMFNSANGQWTVLADNKNYKVLTASITFYKGIEGDEAVFFVPKNNECSWGAVEHIIHV